MTQTINDISGDVMDEGDSAQDYQARLNRAAIDRHRSRPQAAGPAAEYCEECEEMIPPGRRKAQPGCTLCVACQREAETNTRRDEWTRA